MIIYCMMRVIRRILAGESNTWSSTTMMCCRRCLSGTARGRQAWRRRRRGSWRRCTSSCLPVVRPWTPPRNWLKHRRRSTARRTRGFFWRCWRLFHFSIFIVIFSGIYPLYLMRANIKWNIDTNSCLHNSCRCPFLTDGDAYSEKVFIVFHQCSKCLWLSWAQSYWILVV